MAQQLPTKYIRTLGVQGVVRESSVDPALIPEGAVTDAVNVRFDRIGAVTVRPGMTTVGATVTTSDVYTCAGLHNSLSSTLISVFSGGGSARIYEFLSGSWTTSLTGGTEGVSARFVDFGSCTVVVSFAGSMYFWPGAGGPSYWKSTGNPINPQSLYAYGYKLIEVYKSRIYVAGDTLSTGNPSRLGFSSVIASDGTISWTTATDYVDINPGDGESITALKRFSLELLVFKPNYIYRFRTSGVDPDPLIRVGTRSNESVIEGKRGLYFWGDTGAWRYTGGYPEELSRPIADIAQAITFSNLSAISSWKDDDHIYWSVGDVTVAETTESITYKNAVCRYTESTGVWTVYSTPKKITRGSPYITSSSSSIVIGTNHGVVGEFNKGQTDFGEPINYRTITNWYEDGIENRKKIVQVIAICEKAGDTNLMYQTDENGGWQTVGSLKKMVNYMDTTHTKSTLFNDHFHRIRFKISGVSTKEPPIFRGLMFTDWYSEGIAKEP